MTEQPENQQQLPMPCLLDNDENFLNYLKGEDTLLEVDPDYKSKWPKRLVEYVEVLKSELLHQELIKIDEKTANQLARLMSRSLAKYRGGKLEYLPTGEILEIALRDKMIWDNFTGNNMPELQKEYKINPVHLYRILKTQRELHQRLLPRLL